ncbi:origin of replication recognition protein / Cell division control protein 6 [Halarchaeum acidiphilum MH1-52-1]|uniref:ORC1-type DNA replication protein n=1 Tax=Halarchaeum acidiphilum MH1-52-1 TaxID=1261545 RepID=U2YGH5_9EURY|nr:orc1/cdc6 family replication initiation protein [Halarchaeum acidiphilum]GAD53371.1 origin of replication recognition protein / Cell division control protein 6 [Halarchaeum acidiphilum MH1-52-1]
MSESPFEEFESVFRNRDVLKEDYEPDEILERDDEIQDYASALNPARHGAHPDNVFIYGKTGVGKTAVTKYLLEVLETEVHEDPSVDSEITTLLVNCQYSTTSYQALIALLNAIRGPHDQVSATGHAPQDLYNMLWRELDDIGGTILIALDEIDSIGSDDGLLYQLPRARANGNLDHARLGIIGISNDYQFRQNLSPKVKDTLCEREINFSQYDAEQLFAILEQRATKALRPDTYDAAALRKTAAIAARDRGSARQALELLMVAGDLAEERDGVLTESLVDEAEDDLERGRIEDRIRDQTVHAQYSLLALVHLSERTDAASRTKDVYRQYERVVTHNGSDPLSLDRFRDQLDELAMLGFAAKTQANEGRQGGRYNEYRATVATDPVVDILTSETDLSLHSDAAR